MPSAEHSFLLSVLSDHLNHRKTSIPEEMGMDRLYQLSLAQSVVSIFYYQTRLPRLKPFFASENYKALNRRKQLREIHDAFSEVRIPYLIFKGTEIAGYYPYPELRSMGDVDILVHSEDKEKAGNVFERLGYGTNATGKYAVHEWVWLKEHIEIELHHALLYDDNYISFTDKTWACATTADNVRYHLETEFHFVFLLLHLRKHFLGTGVGIRQFVDLAVMIKNANMDWKKVEGYLSQLGLCAFSEKCFGLIAKWFGITAPVLSGQISDDFYESATNMVLSAGVYGLSNYKRFIENLVVNATQKRRKVFAFLSLLFPSYQWMKAKYPGMAKSPLLLPILWVRRVMGFLSRKGVGNAICCTSFFLVKNRSMKEREAVLKQWGLL